MSDKRTIYEEDAIKAVTYGALSSATLFGRSDAGMTALRETVRAIKVLPSTQPEIIRCRDCKHMQKDEIFHQYWCNGNEVKEDHFCGYAERRTDGVDS